MANFTQRMPAMSHTIPFLQALLFLILLMFPPSFHAVGLPQQVPPSPPSRAGEGEQDGKKGIVNHQINNFHFNIDISNGGDNDPGDGDDDATFSFSRTSSSTTSGGDADDGEGGDQVEIKGKE